MPPPSASPTPPPRNLGVATDDHGNSATIQQEPPLPLKETCARVHARVERFLGEEFGAGKGGEVVGDGRRLRDVQAQVKRSLGVLGEALGRYSLDELSLSYNGGKDCLVLLILYLCALHTHFHKPRTATHPPPPSEPQPNGPTASAPPTNTNAPTPPTADLPPPKPPPSPSAFPTSLNTVYIPVPDPIPAVDAFIATSATTYALTLSTHPYPMKTAFATYLASHPAIRAIFVGTRRTDPHGSTLSAFDPTDRGWPDFMRVHPVVEWHYAEVWAFLREVGVPYCGVYDLGFTSLGGRGDTRPNPRLAVRDDGGGGVVGYRPAFELVEDGEERLGREKG